MESKCVYCGCDVPEGVYICPNCEYKLLNGTIKGSLI